MDEEKTDRTARLHSAADKLLEKIVSGIGNLEGVSPAEAKSYADALKNIKEIQMIRSEEDLLEQQARIAKLQRAAEKDENTGGFTVTLEGGLEAYAG